MSADDATFDYYMTRLKDDLNLDYWAEQLRARDTAQREALARVKAELEECSTANANLAAELSAFHATAPWLVEKQLDQPAVGEPRAHTLIRSLLQALTDLDNGYPWKELGVNVEQLTEEAEALGIELDDDED